MNNFVEFTALESDGTSYPISINIEDIAFYEPSTFPAGTIITCCLVYGDVDEVLPVSRIVEEDYTTVKERINEAFGF